MAVVVFDPEKFRTLHPAFADERFSDDALEACFDQAVELVGNEDSELPYDPDAKPPVKTRAIVLDLVTCHIATQSLLWDVTQAGPVASAGQGSTSASFGSMTDASDPAWWMSTRCGAQSWQILKRYGQGPVYFGVENFYMGG